MNCQQGELYAAEGQVPSASISAAELQDYVDELRESSWWDRNFPQVRRIEAYVRDGESSVGSWHEGDGAGVIEMARHHLTELCVLHEVSHVLAAARMGSHSHDPWFARIYLEAAYEFLGPEIYANLAASFRRGGIDADTSCTNPAGVEV